MLRFLLSSRFLRVPVPLSSFLTRSIRKAAVVAFLGVLLAICRRPEALPVGP